MPRIALSALALAAALLPAAAPAQFMVGDQEVPVSLTDALSAHCHALMVGEGHEAEADPAFTAPLVPEGGQEAGEEDGSDDEEEVDFATITLEQCQEAGLVF